MTETRDSGTDWSPPDRPASPAPAPAPGPAAPPGLRIPPPPPPRITLPPGVRPVVARTQPPAPMVGYPAVAGRGPAGWPAPATTRAPSGLFPSSSGPPRPTYREPHPAGLSEVTLGGAAGTLWMVLIGLLSSGARGYVWWTITAGLIAWGSALALARWGLRGVAAGIALTSGLGVSIAMVVVIEHWADGHWLLW